MPSTRVVAGLAAALVVAGVVLLGIGCVLLWFNTGSTAGVGSGMKGVVSAGGIVAVVLGLAGVLGGTFLLTRGRVAQTRARTVVPGMPQVRRSASMLPGGALFVAGIALGAAGVRSGLTWIFVPAALAGLAGMVLFALSGSPDEPA